MKWVSVIPSLSVGRLAMVVFLLGDRWSFGLEGEGEACCGVCCGVGWEQQQGGDRGRGADACGDEAGGAEAVEERVGGCDVDGGSECGVAVEAGAVGERERTADGVVGGARVLRGQRG